ncbi:LPS export ABC transporter permease LptF [Chelatococcus reniformis]|uniref:LPS export ABC transporter permease LptF n=1 Tax=Chelatococcus reniformis TaxID=1494448 RepID=A0A916UE74_9HYPH|nr:LPS export ABC transporter permease LptF [Chelatococcus reniformis]GGC69139.1 LPS export ABC transporter permease LptF [Chelatococcus reniformis]
MSLIERYIFRNVFVSFAGCLLALTLVIWITEALKQMDLLTGKGQTIVVFFTVTALSLPALITVIAPVALFIGTTYALNKLNGDSELIVMSAAGIPPARLLRPFAVSALIVAAIIGWMTIWLMPNSFQGLRDLVTKIRADFVANIVKEGQFTTLDSGITFHYRERSGDTLLGIFFQDRREKGKTVVYLAERGQTVDFDGQSYLVLEKGNIQRQDGNHDSAIVAFDRYAIDLSAFGQDGADVVYKPRERSTGDLLFPDTKDAYYKMQAGRFRAELHDRFAAPLYPIAFMLIAFAALGEARTTRQGRGVAMAFAVIGVVALRVIGFAASSAAVRSPFAVAAIYATPLLGCGLSLLAIFYGPVVSAWLSRADAVRQQLMERLVPLRLGRA